MALSPDRLIAEIDALLARAGLKPGEHADWQSIRKPSMSSGQYYSLGTAWYAAIERLTPAESSYRTAASLAIKRGDISGAVPLASLAGVLSAIRADVEAGFTRSVEELVHADVFGDFLEMADELLDKKFKDPAAVIVGSVLEEHLRKLALVANVPVTETNGRPRKADTINADLTKADVYNKLEQSSVTSWLALRNRAAHGRYEEYELSQVTQLLAEVRAFMIRHPA